MKQIKQQYNNLPEILKYLVWGSSLYIIYNLFIKKSGSEQLTSNVINENENDIKKWVKAGFKPTLNLSDYPSIANTIYEGTKYGVGDNYGIVQAALKKLNNNLDVALLIASYGKKQNYNFGIPDGEPRDLFTNIRKELGSEYGGLTDYRVKDINTNWKNKGITYII